MPSKNPGCVLAYSGGLDTSAIVPWLIERGYDVHALAVDVGQREDWDAVTTRALALGATTAEVRHAVPELIERMLPTAIGLAATYEGAYRLGTALTRPIIALEQVRRARELGCTALAHGATGKGNDQIRFEFAYRSLAPECDVIAPWKSWEMRGRADLARYLEERDVPFRYEVNKTYSLDENLWHLSIEGGELEDPATPLPLQQILDRFETEFIEQDVSAAVPAGAASVVVRFEAGLPVALNGVPLSLEQIVRCLNARFRQAPWAWDLVLENRFTGVKSRGIYINPAAKLLHAAVDGLARNALNRPTYTMWRELGQRHAELLYRGEYFSQQRAVVEAGARAAMAPLSGEVELRSGGDLQVVAARAERGLFREDVATFEASDWSHADAAGFIELSWLGNIGCTADEEDCHADPVETDRHVASGV